MRFVETPVFTSAVRRHLDDQEYRLRMFVEAGGSHHRPHFHAYYQDHAAVFAIDTIDCLGGELPVGQRRLVEAWAEIHRAELQTDWELLQSGRPPVKIEPLR